jgi:hypothetical protein
MKRGAALVWLFTPVIPLVMGTLLFARGSGEGMGPRAPSYEVQLEALAADAIASSTFVAVSVDTLRRLMEEDMSGRRDHIERIRASAGDDAALRAENRLRAPYMRRIQEIEASGNDSLTLRLSIVTVGGSLRFSSVSFDGSMTPKDPVSVLFFGNAHVDRVYADLTGPVPCGEGCEPGPAAFRDHDGPYLGTGVRRCESQTQWVLMGSVGEPLQWRRSVRGVMTMQEGCDWGTRDHIRFFQELSDEKYGAWFVATPHREDWITDRGHVVLSWQEPSRQFLALWSLRRDTRALDADIARSWVLCNARTEGLYQGVPFDGRLAVIAVPGTAMPWAAPPRLSLR